MLVRKEILDRKDRRVIKVFKVPLDLKVLREILVLLVLPDHKVISVT
jgi:hypothetical protein